MGAVRRSDDSTRAKEKGGTCRRGDIAVSRGVVVVAANEKQQPGSTNGRPSVVVVDHRPWVAEAVVALLGAHDLGAELLDPALVGDTRVGEGVALVCVGPDAIGRVVGTLSARGWRVVLYGCGDDTASALALEAGAVAVVGEASEASDLLAIVRRAKTGLPIVEPAERDRLRGHLRRVRSRKEPYGFQTLTAREREILDALVDGRRSKEIAAEDFVSVTTVRNQIQSILTKLNVHSQLEAVAVARRHGWPKEAVDDHSARWPLTGT
jgi:two-component system, NarL family, nitrate/nitrite response regulator NarL